MSSRIGLTGRRRFGFESRIVSAMLVVVVFSLFRSTFYLPLTYSSPLLTTIVQAQVVVTRSQAQEARLSEEPQACKPNWVQDLGNYNGSRPNNNKIVSVMLVVVVFQAAFNSPLTYSSPPIPSFGCHMVDPSTSRRKIIVQLDAFPYSSLWLGMCLSLPFHTKSFVGCILHGEKRWF
jgi:hypothetical protein